MKIWPQDYANDGTIAMSTKRAVILILETNHPLHQRIAIPAHKTLRIGTLSSILRAVADAKQTTRQAILESLAL
ncbi:MAG TPA: hypothetical protein VNU94_03765 [Acidobacteriaceae bacterium]|nr:hypothetical protein [Acidobacteriaceae bacterium]